MATGLHHYGLEDSDEEAFGSETVHGLEDAAMAKRWYSALGAGIKWASSAGHNESSTAERGSQPVYSKLETRSSTELDWRDLNVTIVSSCFDTMYLYNVARPPSPLYAGTLSARSTVLLPLPFHCSSSLFY